MSKSILIVEDEEILRQFEQQRILQALRRHEHDKVATARSLGIGLSSLCRKLDELGIPKNEETPSATRG